MPKLLWKSYSDTFETAQGVNGRYNISSGHAGFWWRYGRNLGQYGQVGSMAEGRVACQTHYEKELKNPYRNFTVFDNISSWGPVLKRQVTYRCQICGWSIKLGGLHPDITAFHPNCIIESKELTHDPIPSETVTRSE